MSPADLPNLPNQERGYLFWHRAWTTLEVTTWWCHSRSNLGGPEKVSETHMDKVISSVGMIHIRNRQKIPYWWLLLGNCLLSYSVTASKLAILFFFRTFCYPLSRTNLGLEEAPLRWQLELLQDASCIRVYFPEYQKQILRNSEESNTEE